VDEFRLKQIQEWAPVAANAVKSGIDSSDRFTAAEKPPTKQIIDLFFDMLLAGQSLGHLDMMVDVTKGPSGKHVILASVVTTDGKKADEILDLLPQARENWKVEKDVQTIGDSAIHKVDASAKFPRAIADFFGPSGIVYVATSPN